VGKRDLPGRAASHIIRRISGGRELNFGKEDGMVAGGSAIGDCDEDMAGLLRRIACLQG
jgi:hypothetical protein